LCFKICKIQEQASAQQAGGDDEEGVLYQSPRTGKEFDNARPAQGDGDDEEGNM